MRAFTLPAGLEADAPAPVRDGVRLLVARRGGITHRRFRELPAQLAAGDVLVINTSTTLPAAVPGTRRGGQRVIVHFAAALGAAAADSPGIPASSADWVVEVRPRDAATGPVPDARADELIMLPDGVVARLITPQPPGQRRLWRARVSVEGGVLAYLMRHGRPISYAYLAAPAPLEEYQTIFARHPGSAEMPSAARPFTDAMITELATRGVLVAPITLHTGVSSPEAGEPPQAERFRVPAATAAVINAARGWGGRIVAAGTTATRAVETATEPDGTVRECAGWTRLVLGPRRPARVITGLITGWHAPGASHLQLLQAVAGDRLVDCAYAEALRQRYRWHEFGDSCLLLP